eukprot:TRINITY_DN15160_c0_g1_i1.p2 TRINITY_DN15160_c0_g1~~TRINITY_DN15160_c0_g1_i1.p2  ORF type:complete len:188 (+),score=32.24 TRINITY_DN15160_c0_g1_i1:1844-2407(+)
MFDGATLQPFRRVSSNPCCGAASTAISLTAAAIVLLMELCELPSTELQSLGRVSRIGQTKSVKVYRFCASQSIEEEVVRRSSKRIDLINFVLERAGLDPSNTTRFIPFMPAPTRLYSIDDVVSTIMDGAKFRVPETFAVELLPPPEQSARFFKNKLAAEELATTGRGFARHAKTGVKIVDDNETPKK